MLPAVIKVFGLNRRAAQAREHPNSVINIRGGRAEIQFVNTGFELTTSRVLILYSLTNSSSHNVCLADD